MKSLAREGDSDVGGALRAVCSVPSSPAAGAAAVPSAGAAGTGSTTASDRAATAGRGTTGVADPSVAGSAGCWLVLMTQTLRPATDSERHTIDHRP
ncbi:hypothetical protein GCM10010271_64040 [Streptomyces kurssanovii]|nr:hypothetical protein GCM10010271_64040 [Streptomyces kurssanovii]